MAQFALADNVKETTTTTGTGTVSLLGAFAASFKTFVNGIGNGKLTAYKIDDGAGNWECRYGVITSGAPDTISNAGFIASSTGVAVSFVSGTKTVTCVPMSELFITAAISPVLAETSIASATTTDLGSLQTVRALITGTTTITGFGTSPNTLRIVRFNGALTLTYNATSLITLTAANRTTVAGNIGMYVSDVSGNWTEIYFSQSTATLDAATATATNNNATAGHLGEYISSTVLSGSAVALAATVSADITSISLTAGDWDVTGVVASSGSASSFTWQIGWTSATSATTPTVPNNGGYVSSHITTAPDVLSVGRQRFSLAGTTTIYLSCNMNFAGGTLAGYGFIGARRVR